jgi:DNA-binding GntR family transcriptional regulator
MFDSDSRIDAIERPPTLTRAAVEAIREAVFAGRFQPGESLTELSLSDSLGVSRGTVRTALRELQGEGLIEIIPHRGAFVRELTPQVATELYSLRAVLERFAVRVAFQDGGYSKPVLDRLQTFAERIGRLEEKLGGPDFSFYPLVETDVAFHHTLCARSGHGLLLQLFEQLESLMWLSIVHADFYQVYVTEPSHLDIVEALRSGDPDLAQEVLVKHIRLSGDALVGQMRDRFRSQAGAPGQA